MSQTKAQLLAPIGIITCPGLDVTVGGSSPFQVGSTGIITAVSASFSGNVTVGGTLTYDDVTNIDSVGLITARSGVDITGASAGVNGSSNLILKTGGSEKVRITSAGKVGMGITSTGGGICDPDGNQLLIRAASTFQTTKGHIMLTGDGATNGEGPQIVFSESGSGGNFAGAYIGHVRLGSNSIGDLVFGTRATSGDANTVPTERLRIGQSGQIGLGGANYGTDGQVLTSKGTGAAPQWAAPAAAWVKLGSGSATSGTTSVVTTNQLTSAYTFYKILFRVRLGTAGAFGINLSTNGGTSYTTADGSWKTAVSGRGGSSAFSIAEACNWGMLLAGNNRLYYAGEMNFNYPDGTTMKPNFNSQFSFAASVAGTNDAYGTADSTAIFDTVGAYNAIRLEATQTIADLKWTFLGMAI